MRVFVLICALGGSLVASGSLGLLTFINCAYVKWGTVVQDVSTYTKLMALLLIIVMGLLRMSAGKVTRGSARRRREGLNSCVGRRNKEL